MLNFIPHKNNSHNWRTLLFVFLVMCFSLTLAYFFGARSVASKNETRIYQPEEIKTDQLVVADNLAPEKNVSQEEKGAIIEKKQIENVQALIERNKNPLTRLDEAKSYAKPQIMFGKYIDVSLRYQNMVLFEDGKALDAYQISSGKKGFDTPVGLFKIENKSPRAWSQSYGLWMPNWMAILPSGKVGIHELPVWPGGYQEGVKHLGIPVSHGCVRLGTGAAKRVYDWAELGTPVIIHE